MQLQQLKEHYSLLVFGIGHLSFKYEMGKSVLYTDWGNVRILLFGKSYQLTEMIKTCL